MKIDKPFTKQIVTFWSNEGDRMFHVITNVGDDVPDFIIAQRERWWQNEWLKGTAFAPAPRVAHFTISLASEVGWYE